jgi:hypothetical protein
MGFLGTLGKIAGIAAPLIAAPFTGGGSLAALGKFAPVLAAAGAGAGAASNAMAGNRGAQIEAQLAQEDMRLRQSRDFYDQMLAREDEGRRSGADAWKRLMQVEYMSGAKGYEPPAGLKSFGFGPKAPTETELAGAHQVRDEVQKRLYGGNPVPAPTKPTPFTIDPKLLKSGIWEKILGIAGPAAQALGSFGEGSESGVTRINAAGVPGTYPR